MNNNLSTIVPHIARSVIELQNGKKSIDNTTLKNIKVLVNYAITKKQVDITDTQDAIDATLHFIKTGKFPYQLDHTPAYHIPSGIKSLTPNAHFTPHRSGFDQLAYDMLYKSH